MASRPILFVLPGVFGEDRRLPEFCAAATEHFTPLVSHRQDGDGSEGLMENGRRAAERMSDAQPRGQIDLLGYSYGGNVAVEAVTILRDLGRKVSFVGIVDPALPDTEFDPFTDEPARIRDFHIVEPRLGLFLLRRRVVWTASRLIPCKTPKREARRETCVTFRGRARRRWSPRPIDMSGLLVTSSQFHGVTSAASRSLCPAMVHIKAEGRHADVMAGAAGKAIIRAVGELGSSQAAFDPAREAAASATLSRRP